MKRSIQRASAITLLAVAAFAAGGCAVNPATGKREFTLITSAQEAAMGREGYAAAVAEYGSYDDAALAAYVDSVGLRVARASEQPDLPWRFTVLDDPVVNAFAMPGGYIYVTRGLLAHMQSEAQLAGVLGHEIAHVTARHSARQLTQQQLAGLGLGIAAAVSPAFRRYSSTAEQALGLLMLKYSRDDESQADELGVRYSSVAGYDPREMPGTYRTLQRIAGRAGQSLPSYLSTHPEPGQRAERTAVLAARAAAGRANLLVRQRGFLDHMRGLVYGENPRYGWFDGPRFFHPVLGLEMTFPRGWKTTHTHTALTGVAPGDAGMLQLTLARDASDRSPGEYLVALTTEGKVASSRGAPEMVGTWPAWVGTLTVPSAQGGPAGQATLVAAFVRVSPDILLQVVGRGAAPGDAAERQVLTAMRSIGGLSDPRRGMVQPNKLRLQTVMADGDFRTAYARLGTSLIPIEDAAILNGVGADEPVMKGQWIKVADAPNWP